jgi:hypothetical protein
MKQVTVTFIGCTDGCPHADYSKITCLIYCEKMKRTVVGWSQDDLGERDYPTWCPVPDIEDPC